MELNKMIDHTLLKSDASLKELERIAIEARLHNFYSVCINPCFVSVMKNLLKGSDVKVCTVIGFPLGANTPSLKAKEALEAVDNGADEIDMVINITMLKEHDYDYIEKEVHMVKANSRGRLLKVILETCLLSNEEISEGAKAAVRGGADYVKTSTGFSKAGATVEAVQIMRQSVPSYIGVKASGGIKTKEDALKMIKAGATRIGTSNGVKIVEE